MTTAVEVNPDGIAVVFADANRTLGQLTYAELDERSTRLARLLIERGVGPEDLVAVGIPRSLESVVAVWAVAKTGAGFVPVDPNYPAERIAHMVADSAAVLGLAVDAVRADLPGGAVSADLQAVASGAVSADLPAVASGAVSADLQAVASGAVSTDLQAVASGVEWLIIDTAEFALRLEDYPAEPITYADRVRPVRAENPAYVIYTSGSTGTPKGVVVTQAGLSSFCDEQRERYRVTNQSRTLHFASPSFDASVLELLLALGGAATMVVVAPTIYGGDELAALLRRERVTHAFITPAVLASLPPDGLDELRVVVAGGEACPPELVRRWVLPISGGSGDGSGAAGRLREFFNGYGPTETTIMTNISAPMTPGETVTIGGPIRAITEYVLDDRLNQVPSGVVGELYISGAQVARGYHDRAGLTAARFVADPFDRHGSRLYRTGDVVRWTASGELEYLGRNDFQVKVRGFRIELGEIDAVLAGHDSVDFAVTVGHELDTGATILVSYVHAADGMPVDIAELTALAARILPAHMVPSSVMVLDEIPLTPVGKLDRRALPAPMLRTKVFRAPSGAVEPVIAGLVAEVLGIDVPVGADDDFFELGGNSLIGIQLMARLGAALDARVPVRLLFQASTVAGLAAVVAEFAGAGDRRVLVAGPRPERIPLSLAQQRMWFLNRFDPTSAAYNIPIAVRLSGALDVSGLRAAVADLVARHEVLRTVYPQTEDGPVQVILPPDQAVPDLMVQTVGAERIESVVLEFLSTTFDVTAEVPLRVALFAVESGEKDGAPVEFVLALVVHHIAGDGTSMGPLTRDLMTAYAARSAGADPGWAPLPVQYADYSIWQRELLGSEDDPESLAAEQVGYWKSALADLPEQLDLPSDRPRPAVQSFAGGTVAVGIDAETHRALIELARAEGATLFMVVHTALAVLLARLSGTDDIVIGSPMAGRGEAALDDLIGMFVNTLVFRTKVDDAAPFSELVARQRESDIAAFAHADVPFERLVEVLNPVRSTARHPLFQVGLSFQNLATTSLELPGLTVSGVDFDTAVSQFDLHWIVGDTYDEAGTPAGINGAVTYATDLFDEITVQGFVDRFARLLGEIIAAPGTAVGELELLDSTERAELVFGWNATAHVVDATATLPSLLDATVAATPGAVALMDADGVPISYGELDARVNRLARYLISLGVGPESRVALAFRRSVDLVVAMYAVATSGAAYVPVDPDQAASRTADILDTAAPVCVLTNADALFDADGSFDTNADGSFDTNADGSFDTNADGSFDTNADASFDTDAARVVRLDRLDLGHLSAAPVADGDRVAPLRAANTAYVIFTSGSTGRPKGVAVSHAAVVNQLLWKTSEFGLGPGDAVLLKTAATFDLSVWEFWSAAVCGGRLVLAAPEGHRDPTYLNELMRATSVTTLHVVPSMLDALLTESGGQLAVSLRRVLAIGEALPAPTAQWFRRDNAVDLFNLYGPTEAAVSVTNHVVTDADVVSVPIGAPEWNSRVYVLDSRLRPVPVGVPGELYLAGAQLARGYFGRADLTADRFVADPFEPGVRMYRTGDLVVWNARGELDYRGRTDFQVKIRGFRIELGEIEAALTGLPQIARAAVIADADPYLGDRLVAYLVPADLAVGVDVAQVKSVSMARLPSYMVPSAFVILDTLPLNVNGKLDRKALPKPEFETHAFRAPSTPIEEIVAGVFADVLGVERIGADDDFFALGGNSLLATQVAARLGVALDAQVPVRVLFEAPTVEALAVRVEQHVGSGGRPRLVAGPRPERVPLSLAQQRMWFLNQFDTASAAYNIPVAVRLTGALDVDALRQAVADVVARHEVLRTIYPETDAGPVQLILPPDQAAPKLEVRRVAPSEIETAVVELTSTFFDVTSEVPIGVALFDIDENVAGDCLEVAGNGVAGDCLQVARNGAAEYVLAMVVHHISGDGSSIGPLTRDLMIAYAARSAGVAPGWVPLPVQYADYSIWQRELLGSEDDPESLAAEQVGYWKSALADLPEQLDLPSDRARPAVQSFAGGTVAVGIDAETHRALIELARAEGATLFMVVHTALAVLLARLSGTDDIVIGSPMAGRGEAALDDLIGMFVNTLVFRTKVDASAAFTDLTMRQREIDIQAFAHADVPFERLVEVLNPVRSTARHPLFQVGLSFQNMQQASLDLPGLSISGVGIDIQVAQFDLNLIVSDAYDDNGSPAGIAGQFVYAKDLFDPETVAGFAERFTRLLGEIIAAPHRPVGELEVLAPAERERILLDWNDTAHPVAPELLLDGYRRAVADYPDAIAVTYEGAELTYREFDQRVNRLARRLIAQGVGTESLVGLAIRRSLELVVGMYAIVTAGGAYVPLDPDHPAERIAHILDTAQPVAVLTTTADAVAVPGDTPVLHLDTLELDRFDGNPVRSDEPVRPVRPENPAYVIFTSGSTGRPKGVAISHGAIHNQTTWMLEQYPLGAGDVYLQKTATTFDVSLWGYFMPLRAGAKLVVATHDGHRDPAYVAETIAAQGVTVTDFVPSMLTVFAAHTPVDACPTLRDIFVIGEALPPETVDAVRAISDARVRNLYGPTEAAVSVTYWAATGDDRPGVPIGLPQWNTQVYVLDSRLRPVPAGVPGELYLTGDQLARGYVRRPDLTSDRFVANPFGAGARMYRTGDLVVWRDTGERGVLDYLGRTDFQVKFRGQRIELGEIETALLAEPSVSQAVAVVLPSALGDQLVAYAVPAPGHRIEQAELLAAIADTLPAYMIPSAIVALDAFPLNTSGKLDRKALPEPTFARREFRAPATPVEEIVAGVFGDVLGLDRVGVDDDFFALGGNSLIATQVVARLGAAIGGRVPVRTLFEASTVGGLAVKIEQHAGSGGRRALTAGPRPERIPLSMAQQRMWFLNQFDTGSPVHNIPAAVRLTGALDITALQLAVADLIARHEVLRTLYPQTDAGPEQRVMPADYGIPDLTPVPVTADEVTARVIAVASTGFDVTTEVPLRAKLFRVESDTEHVLVVVAHHISADGWSTGPLTRDLMVAYASRSAGAAPGWTPLPVQYADFSLWQREVLGSESDPDSLLAAQARYWREQLAGLPDELNLPSDRPRPTTQSFRGGRVVFPIATDLHRGLQEIARAQHATMFMVVHTALAILLARLSGAEDIAVGTPTAGRGEAELDDVIGMFVNTLVLRTPVPGQLSFGELLARTRDADLEAFAHADIPFERLVELLNPERSTARHPLFQVMLSFANLPDSSFDLPGLRITAVDSAIDIAKYDLSLTIQEAAPGAAAGMVAELSFARDLFDDATVQVFAERFTRLLAAITTSPDQPVGDLPLLAEGEFETLTRAQPTSVLAGALLPDLLTRGVTRGPDRIAVRYMDSSITYRELDEYSSQLARVLIGRGVGPEQLVAVSLPRSFETVAAVWAVAKAGGAHVPIDPTYPEDRVWHMVADSGAIVGITSSAHVRRLPDTVEWLALDDHAVGALIAAEPAHPVTDADRLRPLRPLHPAYVIYTSGSTGTPKGVTVTHSGLGAMVERATELYGLGPEHRFLHISSPSFDASILEWMSTFPNGATLVIVPSSIIGGPELTELFHAEQVTHTMITPAVLGTVDPAGLDHLELVSVGGDVTTPELLAKWQPGRRYVNAYGPTESTVVASYAELAPGRHVTIGKPLPGMAALVLDARLNPVPPGVAGELYIAGDAVARGYHGRAALTAERFVANPWGKPGSLMYRTGDVMRWYATSEGEWELDYVGRSDFQVKIRGLRIELGEIDAVLGRHEDIEYAVTIGRLGPAGAQILVSYVLGVPGRVVDPAGLRTFVARSLAPYMVPSAVVVLDEIPQTPIGKLDRRALPEPVLEAKTYRAPSTPLEATVAGVFADVVGAEQVGVDDDFFAIGGNSLLATQVVSRLRKLTGAEIKVSWFFGDSTVLGIAEQIMRVHEYDAGSDAALGVVLPIRAEGTRAPLFCVHPLAGLSWSYAGFARVLPPDQPVLGIQSPALSEDDYVPDSIADIVRRYIAEIRSVQPVGPYRLLGWSLGGKLAHAIAVELQEQGAEVGLLAILDAFPGGDVADVRAEIRQAFRELGLGADALPQENMQEISDEALEALHALVPADLDVLTPDRLRRIYRAAMRTVELDFEHRPGVFHGTLEFFTATGDHAARATGPEAVAQRDHGETRERRTSNTAARGDRSASEWQPFVSGEIIDRPIAATHELMTSAEAFDEIGPRLAELLKAP